MSPDDLTRNKEQRAAVLKLLTRPGNIQVLEGVAGTGKTYVLSVVREILEQAGYHVTGVALSAAAADNLQEKSGIESETIARRLLQLDGRRNLARHHKRQLKRLLKGKRTYAYRGRKFTLNRHSVLIVDEAAMVGTRDMAASIKHARKVGAKIIWVGDRRQLQPIAAGGAFSHMADATDKAELKHVIRQNIEPDDPNPIWHREAGKLIAEGRIPEAVQLFSERGRFSVHDDRDAAMFTLVRNWTIRGIEHPNDQLVLAGTRAEVAQLNAMCQDARRKSGHIGSQVVQIGDYQFSPGDVVLFRRNARLHKINNGDRGTVLSFNLRTRTMAVQLHATGKTVLIPYRDYTEMQLGYAQTTHLAQGATVPNVHVLLGGPMQDRHLSYVQATRACESTRLYVDRRSAAGNLLLTQMERLRPKLLARDVLTANSTDIPPEAPQPEAKPIISEHLSPPPSPPKEQAVGLQKPVICDPPSSEVQAPVEMVAPKDAPMNDEAFSALTRAIAASAEQSIKPKKPPKKRAVRRKRTVQPSQGGATRDIQKLAIH